ncbi:MAG: glycosyltransferase family 4 protein [Anaerolineae bacterium]|nr:glycosyltransferase family 4 protein [Anaerolineae bacterium]
MNHILLVHQAFVSPQEAGGTRHYEFARLLTSTGQYRFTIIASTLSYLTGQHNRSDSDSSLGPGIQVLRAYTLPSTHRSFLWRVIAFFSFMIMSIWTSRKAGHVDLVMGTTPPIFQAVSAWFIAFVRRKPFLLEVRDLWPEFAIDMGVLKNPILIRMSRWLEAFLYSRATHILVNSPAYRDYMLRRGIPSEKVTLIPNGVDPEMFNPEAKGTELRKRLNLDDKFIVTYAGALGQANDIGTILCAAYEVRDCEDIYFLMVGDGKERVNLERHAQEIGLTNVTFTGALPKSEMPNVLAASDVCVATLMNIPMFKTTYPNKVFDYMAAGRPTILGIDGVIREVVEASKGGIFVNPGSSEELAKAVQMLYDDRDRARAMGRAARSHVVEHFNRSNHVKSFAELLNRVANP